MQPDTRRGFLQMALGSTVLADALIAQTTSASAAGIPMRPLGKTGVKVSMLGLGGHHAARPKEESESIRIIHSALDEGITFMDNAWEYHNGRAEEVMGKALAMDGKRQKAFLMTKVCDRDYQGAKRQLEESLRRLRTDVIDLWQFHECNYYNDAEYLEEQGGLRAALEAKKEGKVRFIGFTGHKAPRIHLKLLAQKFPWDACQMPNNVMDAEFLSFREEVMPVCMKRGVGIVGMKGCGGDARMMNEGHVTLEECYQYFLSQPVAVQVVGLASMEHLQNAVRMARSFKPLTPSERSTLLSRVRKVSGDGRYELFKSSQRYDSGHHRKQHGFAT
jgi:uncharacterized protein